MATASPTGVEPETNPEVERLLREQRAELSQRMSRAEWLSEGFVGVAFLVAAGVVLLVGGTDDFDPVAAVVLVLAYAGAASVRFEMGGGWTNPTLLVLIPALFVEPPAVAPFIVLGGYLLWRLPDYLRGTAHPESAVAMLGNSWHAIGPALVLALAVDPGDPRFADAGWYVLAFLAYVLCDAASGLSRQWVAHSVRPGLQLAMLREVYALDALLAPAGLLAALATAREPYAFLLAAPLLVALGVLARERGKRLDNALALSESRAQVLEAELQTARTRVEVLGAVSHGLQTPVAGILAIAGVLARRGGDMPAPAVATAAGRLEGEAVALRQVVRQALDYVRLVDGQEPGLRMEDVDAAAIAREVAARHPVEVVGAGEPLLVQADAARVHQLVTALVARALSVSEDQRAVTLALRAASTAAGTVELSVTEQPPPPDAAALNALLAPPSGALGTFENQGTGIDLYVAAALAAAMGGALAAGPDDTHGGTRWTLHLPAARPAP